VSKNIQVNRLALYGCRLKSHSWSDNMSQTCISQNNRSITMIK